MQEKVKNIKFNFKVWLESEDKTGILGLAQMNLLKAIAKLGTLNKAIEEMGFQYRKTWDKLKKIESLLGFKIICTHRGGCNNGNTELTSKGKLLVEAIEKFHSKCEILFREKCKIATDKLNNDIKKLIL